MSELNLGYFMGYNAKPVVLSATEQIGTIARSLSGSIYTDGQHGTGVAADATVSTQVVRALALIAGLDIEGIKYNFRYNNEVSNVEILKGNDQIVEVAQYNFISGILRASEYDMSEMPVQEKAMFLSPGNRRGTAILMALMPEIIKDAEANSMFEEAISHLKNLPAQGHWANRDDFECCVATLSDNIYFRLKSGALKFDINGTNDSALMIMKEKKDAKEGIELEVGNKDWMVYKATAKKSSARKTRKSKKDNFAGKYVLNENRKLTADEENLIPTIPEWYVVPTVAEKIATAIKKSTGMNRVIRNIMLKGPAGTGKTEISKAIAASHNLPYTHITCSAGMELIDLLGTFVPQPDGTFLFQESELLKAVKNGWVCEVQEPTVIIQPGVLPGLNSLLEGGSITLLNGEVIERHPDSVIIFTTNVDYEGCRSMNESVEDRFPLKFYVELPEDDEMVERVKKVTNFKGEDVYIKAALNCLKETQEYLESLGYSTGKVGARVLYDWIDACQIFENMAEAADYTLVQSASDDIDIQDYIKNNIVLNVNWKNLAKTA